ncbi:hypothetical protein FA10DRAFT_268786 [Acaromyces ingoldii]|uniref:WH2 domain-containing protein n=1 Tax=Acaromyces ingoldii TaxID=215250 RepID=A0A316YGE7_9BASI|nr:hypothetical protein FA10DRAFT_268786 [Acaromyces ingoldii]PWN88610.1 hypothetical protein FA10DRAFT_268786 [Acaromyces ingoldii]
MKLSNRLMTKAALACAVWHLLFIMALGAGRPSKKPVSFPSSGRPHSVERPAAQPVPLPLPPPSFGKGPQPSHELHSTPRPPPQASISGRRPELSQELHRLPRPPPPPPPTTVSVKRPQSSPEPHRLPRPPSPPPSPPPSRPHGKGQHPSHRLPLPPQQSRPPGVHNEPVRVVHLTPPEKPSYQQPLSAEDFRKKQFLSKYTEGVQGKLKAEGKQVKEGTSTPKVRKRNSDESGVPSG